MQKRKGFTLVELVIVIAVIAILAGVLIGTFASVINKANESAKMQEIKAQEIEQKAEDLLKKIDDSNWYGWEDFEVSLAEKLTTAYKESTATNKTVTPEGLREALDEYFKKYTTNQTSLTEEQVKAIVENALGSFKFNGVTEAQVRAIVDAAASGISSTQLTASQVKSIVNAANAKNLTLADVVKAITDANLATSADVTTLTNALSTIQASLLTEEQVESIIKTYLPVTVTVTSKTEAESQAQELNSGSTIIFSNMDDAEVEIDLGTDYKTLYFNGKVKSFTVTAPNATIVLNGEYVDVTVEAVAYNCLHINGTVETLTLKQGKAILDDATVETVVVEAESAKVVVELSKEAKITQVLDVQKSAGTVAVENKGTIQKVTAGDEVKAGEAVVKNVDNGIVTDLPGSDDGNADEHVVITDATGSGYKIYVRNQQELEAALVFENNGKVIVIDADFEVASTVDVPEGLNVTINLNGHLISAALRTEGRHYYALDNYGILTIVDTVGTGAIEARGIENLEGATLTLESGRITAIDGNGGAAIWHEQNAKLYVNGGTLTATYAGPAIGNAGPGLINSSGYTVITGGEFVSASVRCYAICVEDGETIIDNVTVEGTHGALAADGGKLVVNGGTYTAKNYYGLYVSCDAGTADVVVNGGSFKGGSVGSNTAVHLGSDVQVEVDSCITIKGGIFLNQLRIENKVTLGTDALKVSGGSFTYDTAATNVPQFVIDGYKFDTETKTVLAE